MGVLRALLLALLSYCPPVRACSSGPTTTLAARNRALAHAAPNLDPELRAAKCQRADFGIYHAPELRNLATLYEFMDTRPAITVQDSSALNCGFDSPTAVCAWYSPPLNNAVGFNRGRFESLLDLEKFDCTSDRSFPFDDYFLVAGGEDRADEISAALDAQIPCQFDKALLRFDYWANNETPVLKICVIPEENMFPQCEETKLDRNPLTFEIPQNLKPFRLRILAENIGRDDIILLDNLHYDGQICEVDQSSTPSVLPLPLPTTTTEAAVTLALPSLPFTAGPSLDLEQNIVTEDDVTATEASVLVTNDDRIEPSSSTIDPALDPCRVLVCDFNHGDACMFERSGIGATAEWRVGDSATGNPHTGIRKHHPSDGRLSGFAYVGLDGNDFSNEVFVMESHKFYLTHKAYLTFDLYHRSKGPELKICINSFEDCPYQSPPLDVSQIWKTGQTVLLGEYAERVLFIAGKVRQNLFLAVDNIRLQNLDGSDYCASRRK